MSFFTELKRRNVFRVGAAYLVASWLIIQLVETIFPAFGFGDGAVRNVVVVLAAGLVPALILAWAFELTAEGVKRDHQVDRSQPHAIYTRRTFNRTIIVLLVAALSFFIFDRFIVDSALLEIEPDETAQSPDDPQDVTQSRSVAVLPFVAMSRGEDDEYFADGLTEEILNSLAALPELLVTARTSAFHFKGTDLPVPEIAATLGVANVVDGSVRRDRDRVRITAQLIRASDGFHLWSQTYDRTLEDVFAVQEDIARNIAEVLDVVLDEDARRRMRSSGIGDVEAFIAYQKGSEAFAEAHGDIENVSSALAEANAWFDQVLEVAPELTDVRLKRADLLGHHLFELAAGYRQETYPGEGKEVIQALQDEYALAWDSAQPGVERVTVETERTIFNNDWTGLSDKLNEVLGTDECSSGNWINQMGDAYGWAEVMVERTRNDMRCDPLSAVGIMYLVYALIWAGEAEIALQEIRDAEAMDLSIPFVRDLRLVSMLAAGKYDEDPQAYDYPIQGSLYPFPGGFLRKAMAGDPKQVRRMGDEYLAQEGVDDNSSILAAVASGNREAANAAATRIDQRPGGPFILLQTTLMCFCGAPFDLEATPNFEARLEESGFAWPPPTILDFPLKDW